MNHKLYPSLRQVQCQKRANKPYLISIAVRVLNEIQAISMFWKSVADQTIYDDAEIVFLDSVSTDGTLEVLKTLNCNIYTIDKKEFKYGDTCNLMMELTTSKNVYFFSGHVILESKQLLENSYNQIKNDAFSGYFRQVPNDVLGYSIYDKAFLKNRFPKYVNNDPLAVKNKHSFSNAASIINRDHWSMIKFEDVLFGEDAIWANNVLANDGKIYYFHNYNVLHSHKDTYDDVYKRVKMAAKVKYPQGTNPLKLTYIFSKVFLAIFFDSKMFSSSLKYAYAHTKAYKDIKKND